jgi:hypothetical protein
VVQVEGISAGLEALRGAGDGVWAPRAWVDEQCQVHVVAERHLICYGLEIREVEEDVEAAGL